MAKVFGDGVALAELNGATKTTPLTVSGLFKEGPKSASSRRRTSVRPSFDADNEVITLLPGSNLVKVEPIGSRRKLEVGNVVRSSCFWVDSGSFLLRPRGGFTWV